MKMMSTCIVWFRNDLRLYDHEALFKASTEYDYVLPVFVLDRQSVHAEAYGIRRMGSRRAKFLLESLADLNGELRKIGSTLLYQEGTPEKVLTELAIRHKVKAVLALKAIGTEEAAQEKNLADSLRHICDFRLFHDSSLYHVADLPMRVEDLPTVFTDFRKRLEKYSKVRSCYPSPKKLTLPVVIDHKNELPTLFDLGYSIPHNDYTSSINFKGGENQAWLRLNHYVWESELIRTYKETRNGLLGIDYSSKISPWLSLGCISARAIFHEIVCFEETILRNESTYWLIFELIWRDYFRWVVLKFGKILFRPGGIQNRPPKIQHDRILFDAWCIGQTGIPFIDANMRELQFTGFMSNRGRQNVASFLVKDMMQDWRFGATWFEHHLIDYDVSNNWGNWAYVAGVGNDPRSDRYFNILSQAERYDPEGEYVKHWIPELKDISAVFIHKPWLLNSKSIKEHGLEASVYAQPHLVPTVWKL